MNDYILFLTTTMMIDDDDENICMKQNARILHDICTKILFPEFWGQLPPARPSATPMLCRKTIRHTQALCCRCWNLAILHTFLSSVMGKV